MGSQRGCGEPSLRRVANFRETLRENGCPATIVRGESQGRHDGGGTAGWLRALREKSQTPALLTLPDFAVTLHSGGLYEKTSQGRHMQASLVYLGPCGCQMWSFCTDSSASLHSFSLPSLMELLDEQMTQEIHLNDTSHLDIHLY